MQFVIFGQSRNSTWLISRVLIFHHGMSGRPGTTTGCDWYGVKVKFTEHG